MTPTERLSRAEREQDEAVELFIRGARRALDLADALEIAAEALDTAAEALNEADNKHAAAAAANAADAARSALDE